MIYKTALVPIRIDTKEVIRKQEMRYVNYRIGGYEAERGSVSVVPFSVSYDDDEHNKYTDWLCELPFTHAIHLHTPQVDVMSIWYLMNQFNQNVMKRMKERRMQYYYIIEFGKENGTIHLHGLIKTNGNQLDITNAWKDVNGAEWKPWMAKIENLSALNNKHQHIKYVCKNDLVYREVDNQVASRDGVFGVAEYYQHLVKANIQPRKKRR